MTFLLHTYRLKWSIGQNTTIIFHSVGDHVAFSLGQHRLTPSILSYTLCVYLNETFAG